MDRTLLPRRRPARAQRGVTMLVVLVLLSAMLLGGLAMARLSEVGTLASGNSAWHDAALQASEVGLNTAFAEIKKLANEDADSGNWYRATIQPKDTDGLPSAVDWESITETKVGALSVRYVVERVCNVAAVTDALRQCLVRHVPQTDTNASDRERLDPPNSKQFRITVRVTGPKGTQTFVQSLVNKGST